MGVLRTFTRDLVRSRLFIPLLIFSSFALSLILPYSSSFAETGYITRDRQDYDGFIAGTADTSNRSTAAANLYKLGSRQNNSVNYTGAFRRYPYMCIKQDGTGFSCVYEALTGGSGRQQFNSSLIPSGGNLNGFDYSGDSAYWLQNSFQVPSSWYGHKVIVSWDFEVSTWSSATGYTHDSSLVELNWGAVAVIPRSTMSQTCQDVPSAFVYDGNGTNDFIRFAFDYTNIDPSENCWWDFRLGTDGYNASGSYKFLMANFRTVDAVLFDLPYIAYDVVPEESSGAIEDIVDDWKTQQKEEWDYEKGQIESAAQGANATAGNLNLNFNVINVFSNWLNLFSSDSCVNIPTLAGLIHSNDTRVCSPWSSTVRNITSPIFATFGTILLSFFIYKWLIKDEGSVVS